MALNSDIFSKTKKKMYYVFYTTHYNTSFIITHHMRFNKRINILYFNFIFIREKKKQFHFC